MRKIARELIMKFFVFALFVASSLAANSNGIHADDASCEAHTGEVCNEPGSEWRNGPCNAIHGGFKANSNNLHQLMADHFKDSFKFLLLGSHFNTDELNRMGMHSLLQGYSDKMWENGKSIMKYILQRGGRIGQQFSVRGIDVETTGEVDALAKALDTMKRSAEGVIATYRHATSKTHRGGNGDDPFDPAIAHFLEENFLESYASDIRSLSGSLNSLAKMARVDKSKAMALHLFDNGLTGK